MLYFPAEKFWEFDIFGEKLELCFFLFIYFLWSLNEENSSLILKIQFNLVNKGFSVSLVIPCHITQVQSNMPHCIIFPKSTS